MCCWDSVDWRGMSETTASIDIKQGIDRWHHTIVNGKYESDWNGNGLDTINNDRNICWGYAGWQ